jgi:hypothetical protein
MKSGTALHGPAAGIGGVLPATGTVPSRPSLEDAAGRLGGRR